MEIEGSGARMNVLDSPYVEYMASSNSSYKSSMS